jgi:hypothetical protein
MVSRPRSFRSLRTLIQQIPTKVETNQAFSELLKDTNDRAVGIVAAALLESALETTLVFKLKKIGADNTNEIFRGDAPFGTFSAKIKLARAINLIGDPARHDFDCVREIRNAFAFTKRAKITFETSEIAVVCERINFPVFGDDAIKERGISRYRFLSSCILYTKMLMEMATPGRHPFSKKELGRAARHR